MALIGRLMRPSHRPDEAQRIKGDLVIVVVAHGGEPRVGSHESSKHGSCSRAPESLELVLVGGYLEN